MQRIHNFRQTYYFNWYILFWFIALAIIFYLFRNRYIDKQFIGIVERKSHQIGAQESGKVQTMFTMVGERVNKDQVLAMLDISDLTTHISQLNKELAKMQEILSAQRDLCFINTQRIILQLANEASELMDRLSMIEAKSTELAGLNVEIERLKKAERSGLGYSKDLSTLILQRDALASYLQEQSEDLAFQKDKLAKIREARKILATTDVDSVYKSQLIEQIDYMESLQREIISTEHRISLRTILSPCNGYATEIFAHPGDIVDAFEPVLIVEELKPRFLDVYLPENSNLEPLLGMRMKIYSSRNKAYHTDGTITFIHPGFSQVSDRLSFRGQIFWARKIRVELPTDHQLIPGELVKVRFDRGKERKSHFSFISALANETKNTQSDKQPTLKNMAVPEKLWRYTRFEPSGIIWLSDISRYLIVSDDTGIQHTKSEHAAIAFLMDENGIVNETPVTFAGIKEVNDLEAIARGDDKTLYLISSQSISKKGKRPKSRESILRIIREDGKYKVNGQIRLLSALLKSYSRSDLIDLGLEKYDIDGKPLLNIEGAAFRDGALYLGLKEPISKNGAIIWELKNVDTLFQNQRLLPGQLSVYGYVRLCNDNKNLTGISGLTFDQNGTLWVLSTIPGAEGDEQTGGLHRINSFADGQLKSTHIFSYAGLKPEGVTQGSVNKLMIIFDNDNAIPVFCIVNLGEL